MIVKSNFTMLREFSDFKPKWFGILDGNEVKEIRNHFQLAERSDVDLQNLRDFVVLYYSEKMSHERGAVRTGDIMSGIVGVIDHEKASRGLEV